MPPMRIVIAAPLFPPDTAPAANYVKELARRLARQAEVSVLTYGAFPEHIEGVHIIAVRRDTSLLLRLMRFTWLLAKETRSASTLLLQNGPSVEFPYLCISPLLIFRNVRVLFYVSDADEHARAKHSFVRMIMKKILLGLSHPFSSSIPTPRPEILPFAPYPNEALAAYEGSWKKHVEELRPLLS